MKLFIALLITIICISACSKSDAAIDVSSQNYVDYSGNFLGSTGSGAASGNDFTSLEIALFNNFDTADLSIYTKPDSVYNTIIFPNPSSSQVILFCTFNADFSDSILVKYVITDNSLRSVYRSSGVISGSNRFGNINPSIPIGKYRLFVTLSAKGNDNFYTYWVNITRQN
ncbi:MAG TPA: hypothetical protein VK787_10325 [Puia sp.]|jgi:hypothetical protein|nr:hypothetical protein [Puia sp.]